MNRLLINIIVLGLFGCVFAMSAKQQTEPVEHTKQKDPEVTEYSRTGVVTIFVTGNELGELKPCGCSGGQLGGFDRRAAILNRAESAKRLIIDTGNLVEQTRKQDLIKFGVTMQAFELLGYDMVNFTGEDINTAMDMGLLAAAQTESGFEIITAAGNQAEVNLPSKFTKRFLSDGRQIEVTVAAFDVESKQAEQISEQLKGLFDSEGKTHSVNILIINSRNAETISLIAKERRVDCLICPAESDEPELISSPTERPLIISPGQYGRYVVELQTATSTGSERPTVSFSMIPVSEDLLSRKPLVELYKDYQQMVKQAGLIEKHPRYFLEKGLKYTGSESCRSCHEYEYSKWKQQPHSRAWQTLVKAGTQFDPECVLCHVVGMEYEGGFVSEKNTGHLKNVGCENCHGPGSKHVESYGAEPTGHPKSDCTDCHTPEHSSEYAEREKYYFKKIIHWREPNTADDVNN